ncbi:DUF4917 family protein [Phenylobacterium sp. LH3H17]|uniref:DUF4917 family protein n=1 Tax=Phenylobacterium sp. LH3H17 TaxID=2903901 RepID=UPI0020CA0EB7|nr:DUF4917 family protein [Phenylobacterium sp. LH3H17]UTP38004.1 DUF4917 family protein [Phenylobacterium sp. LH3H17]
MTEHARFAVSGVKPITFAEALEATKARRRHLLLGNGFSIGVHRAFGYGSLFEDAVAREPSLRDLFAPGDPNFEVALERCLGVSDADRLREGLIRAVAAVHPEHSLSLTEQQCLSCRDFLEHFVGRNRSPLGTLFTTNYDMLLHWVLSRQGKNPGTKQRSQLKCWDGFDARGEWNPNAEAQAFYLHGAVHIYEHVQPRFPDRSYTKMLRYEWGRPLTKQVDAELKEGRFPVFIAEGNSQKKRARQRLEYLAAARAKFRTVCRKDPGAVLFTFGHSFGQSDNHIAEEIGAGTVREVFIGVFLDGDRARAQQLAATWSAARVPPVGRQSSCVRSIPLNAASGVANALKRRNWLHYVGEIY